MLFVRLSVRSSQHWKQRNDDLVTSSNDDQNDQDDQDDQDYQDDQDDLIDLDDLGDMGDLDDLNDLNDLDDWITVSFADNWPYGIFLFHRFFNFYISHHHWIGFFSSSLLVLFLNFLSPKIMYMLVS